MCDLSVIQCNFCGNISPMKLVGEYTADLNDYFQQLSGKKSNGINNRRWRMYLCLVCQQVTLLFDSTFDIGVIKQKTNLTLYPAVDLEEAIPKNIRDAFKAALRVKSIDGAICSLSLRRTLEMICKDRGEIEGSLFKKISNLAARGILPPTLNDIASVLREVGNDAAHGDDVMFPYEVISKMIDLTESILKYIYVLPEQLDQIKIDLQKKRDDPKI